MSISLLKQLLLETMNLYIPGNFRISETLMTNGKNEYAVSGTGNLTSVLCKALEKSEKLLYSTISGCQSLSILILM